MATLKARFDGHVLVPTQPVELPIGPELEISVQEISGGQSTPDELMEPPLAGLVEILRDLPNDPNTPTDLAAQHDHYLHGMPKRP